MALNNYTNLKQAIEDWSHRNDVHPYLDDFIDIAEAEIFKYLRIREMQQRATATTNNGTRFLQLPDEYVEMRRLQIESGGRFVDVLFCVPSSLQIVQGSGQPRFFTTTSQLEFDRLPDSSYTIEMQYWKRLTALSDSNTTNDLLARFPDIYLTGALWALYKWANEFRTAENKYQEMRRQIKDANDMDSMGRVGPTPAMRVDGPTP